MKKICGVFSVILGLLGFVPAMFFVYLHFNYFIFIMAGCILGGLTAVFFVLRTFDSRGVRWKELHTGERIGTVMLGIISSSFCMAALYFIYRTFANLIAGYQLNLFALIFFSFVLLVGLSGIYYLRLTFTNEKNKTHRDNVLDDSEIKRK